MARKAKLSKKNKEETAIAEYREEKADEAVSQPNDNSKRRECNRCGHVFNELEMVVREQQKCCPECLAPVAWGA